MSRIPLTRVFAEGAVIVVSILLAFAIDRWAEGLRERDAEQALLGQLETELQAARESLVQAIEFHERYANDAREVLEVSLLPGAEPSLLQVDAALFLLVQVLIELLQLTTPYQQNLDAATPLRLG